MKLALLGDIHGNHLALQAVLTAATSQGVDKLLITGDLVGYYFAPLKVLRLLETWDSYIVRGNHEEMLDSARSDPDFLMKVDTSYGPGLRIALEQLSKKQVDKLCNLPHPLKINIDGSSILLCHGSPLDISKYIYPDMLDSLQGSLNVSEFKLIILGHTHYPMNMRVGNTLIVNPGSVGQPRNRMPGAHWAIFDTDNLSAQFFCEYYDSSSLVAECSVRASHLPYLADVLIRK